MVATKPSDLALNAALLMRALSIPGVVNCDTNR
jgi:hypothetical protein